MRSCGKEELDRRGNKRPVKAEKGWGEENFGYCLLYPKMIVLK